MPIRLFSTDRQRARYESERVADEDEEGTEDVMVNQPRTSSENQSSEATEDDVEAGGSAAEPNGQDEEEIAADAAPSEEPPQQEGDRIFVNRRRSSRLSRNTMTLAELEEQRELSRRRSSACVLLAVFVLFRLWIECLQKSDPFLLMLCLLGTSWTARWVRFNREREEELDRRIEAYLQNNNNANEMDRNEYARMSFQAQLALAIMESQRHMMEGGYGRPDGEENTPGVSEEAKGRWKQFQWNSAESITSKQGDYDSIPPTKGQEDELDHTCSICLCEYEDSETLTQLPCGHVYHNDCIQSWTSNHVKCPLCNLDLESTVESTGDSIV